MLKTSMGRLRVAGWIEAISFLLLLGVAMPLKYLAQSPHMVTVMGWIHGVLFIALCLAIGLAIWQVRLPLKAAALAFLAALVPFGPFLIDRHLKKIDAGKT